MPEADTITPDKAPPKGGGPAPASPPDYAARAAAHIEEGEQQLKKTREQAESLPFPAFRDPPPIPQLTPAPQYKPRSPLESFGSLASVVGILGGFLTRTPLQTALNASAAAMNSLHRGDLESYKVEYQNWKQQTDYALEVSKMQNERYKEIWENDKYTYDQKVNLIKVAAQLGRDEVTLAAAETGNGYLLERIFNDKETSSRLLSESTARVNLLNSRFELWQDFTKSDEYKNMNPQQRMKKYNEFMLPAVAAAQARPGTLQQAWNLYSELATGQGDTPSVDGFQDWYQKFYGQKLSFEQQKELAAVKAQARNKTDQAIVNDLGNFGMTSEDLGFIPTKSQASLKSAIRSMGNIEHIADYATKNPDAVGLLADAQRRMNVDAWKNIGQATTEQQVTAVMDGSIDAAIASGKYRPDTAAKAKILNKMLTTQAFNDAAAVGARGGTVFLDKVFQGIYQQASSMPAFLGILHERESDAQRELDEYRMTFDKRQNKEQYPLYNEGPEKYAAQRLGGGPPVVRSQQELDTLKQSGRLKKGDKFIWTDGKPYTVE